MMPHEKFDLLPAKGWSVAPDGLTATKVENGVQLVATIDTEHPNSLVTVDITPPGKPSTQIREGTVLRYGDAPSPTGNVIQLHHGVQDALCLELGGPQGMYGDLGYRSKDAPGLWLRDHKGTSPHNKITGLQSGRKPKDFDNFGAIREQGIKDLKAAGRPLSEIQEFTRAWDKYFDEKIWPTIESAVSGSGGAAEDQGRVHGGLLMAVDPRRALEAVGIRTGPDRAAPRTAFEAVRVATGLDLDGELRAMYEAWNGGSVGAVNVYDLDDVAEVNPDLREGIPFGLFFGDDGGDGAFFVDLDGSLGKAGSIYWTSRGALIPADSIPVGDSLGDFLESAGRGERRWNGLSIRSHGIDDMKAALQRHRDRWQSQGISRPRTSRRGCGRPKACPGRCTTCCERPARRASWASASRCCRWTR